MKEKGLKFEFHWLEAKQADAAYDEIEKRDWLRKGIQSDFSEEEVAQQREGDWFESRPRILNEVMREKGIDLGNRFHPFDREDADLSEDDIDTMLEKWDKEDEAGDVPQPETSSVSEAVHSKIEYAEHIREEIDTLLDISYQRSLGVFIALARDELNDVTGMIAGYIRKKDTKARVMDYSTLEDTKAQGVAKKLHEIVEEKLQQKKIEEMITTLSPDGEHRSTLSLLEKMRYSQEGEVGEEFCLNISVPLKERKKPRPYKT